MTRSRKSLTAMFLPLRTAGSKRTSPKTAADNPAIQAIWDVICRIPRGEVSTYGGVARAAGLPGRARLTGFALRTAPAEMNIPWHRVLGASGRIVFPKLSISYREQVKRLRREGVIVKDGRVALDRITDAP
jgi:methylated-DNA-protein-cysteine methyltransferase related protein